eukprot:955014_1
MSKLTPPVEFKLGGVAGCNAISSSPEENFLIAGGRDVLCLVEIRHNSMHLSRSLRPRRPNLTYSTVDVKWCPNKFETFATSATNSTVILWNLSYVGSKMQLRILNDHSRTVNRICWHSNGTTLLSASQDGTTKLWDTRTRDPAAHTFCGESQSVRDVQYHPSQTHSFACSFDSGAVQIWDDRKPSNWVKQIRGHHAGPVLAIDWHPSDENLLATGSRDKTIKIWHTLDISRPVCTVQTVACVARVKWHPSRVNQMASSSSIWDFGVHVWDIERPHVPIVSFLGHKDVATGLLWRGRQHSHSQSDEGLISCSRDGTLLWHTQRSGHIPREQMSSVALDWNSQGEIAFSSAFVDSGGSGPPIPPKSCTVPFFSHPHVAPLARISHRSLDVNLFRPENSTKEGQSRNLDTFTILARKYRLSGADHTELLAHNEKVARSAGLTQAAQVWSILKFLFESAESEQSEHSLNESNVTESTEGSSELPHTMMSSAEFGFGSGTDFLSDSSSYPIFLDDPQYDIHEHGDVRDESGSHTGQSKTENDIQALLDCLPEIGRSHDFPPAPPSPPAEKVSGGSCLIPSPALISCASEGSSVYSPQWTSLQIAEVVRLSGQSMSNISTISLPPPTIPAESNTTHTLRAPLTTATRPERTDPATVPESQLPPSGQARLVQLDRAFRCAAVASLLDFVADRGDVQTACVLIAILGSRIDIDPRRRTEFFLSYTELLQRRKLWTQATELGNVSRDAPVHNMSKNHTTLNLGCPKCNRSMPSPGYMCRHCAKSSSQCAVCHLSVKGLFAWCQGCGHGGHLKHM